MSTAPKQALKNLFHQASETRSVRRVFVVPGHVFLFAASSDKGIDECVSGAKRLDVVKRSVLPPLSENGCLYVFDCVSRAPPGAKEQAPQPFPLLHSRWGVVEVLELNSEGALRIAVVSSSLACRVHVRGHLSYHRVQGSAKRRAFSVSI